MKPLVLICALMTGLALAGAPDSGATTRTSAFAPIDPGVRAAAMGGAYTAVGGDPTAMYWNPATLFYLRDRTLEASYTDLYGLGLARRSFITFGVKTELEEPSFDGQRVVLTRDRETGAAYAFGVQSLFLDLDESSYSELSLGGAAAWGYGDHLAAGITGRLLFVSSDVDGVSAFGYNLGFGASYRYSSREQLAVSVPHLLSRLFWDFEGNERLPLGLAVGWSRQLRDDLLLSLESEWREGEPGPYRLAVGSEWWAVPERLAVRGGFRRQSGDFEDVHKPTFGVGVMFSQLRFDYGFRLEPDALGDSHRLGAAFRF